MSAPLITGSPLILAIDQGTSSTKCLLVDAGGHVVARGQAGVGQSTPRPGWVEQDGDAIFASLKAALAATLTEATAHRIVAVGLSTQRESCVIWDRATGAALTPVLSWQDQRTEPLCAAMRARGEDAYVRKVSGLPLDPMFSAVKAKWLLDRIDPTRARARAGELAIGTIDSFLLARIGGVAGDSGARHVVEAGNASRMQLVDVAKAAYDDGLLALFDIPRAALPEIVPSTGPFPATRGLGSLPDGIPIRAVMADSHAALFAHGAFAPGPVKATQGTGSSVMGLLDRAATRNGAALHPGVCLTLAWWIDAPVLAFEGNIRAAGSTLVWTADLLGVDPQGLAALAATVTEPGDIQFIPAFNGLGAPWWDGGAVATLSGFTLGASRAHIARAALDSIAHQIADVLDAVRASGVPVESLNVDAGPTRNDQLMQFEADMTAVPVIRTDTAELSALGVAHLAGLGAGIFTRESLKNLDRGGATFNPAITQDARANARNAWQNALTRARSSHGVHAEAAKPGLVTA